MRFSIISHSRLFFVLSGVLVAAGLILLAYPGLKMGIDFTGGTLIELAFGEEVEKERLEETLNAFASENGIDIGQPSVLQTREDGAATHTNTSSELGAGSAGGAGFIIRMKDITNDEHVALQEFLGSRIGSFTERRFTTIGPTVGRTLKVRSFWALLVAMIVMVLYIAFAFRNIPSRLNPWKFGVIAVIALLHDLIVTIGFFAFLGPFTGFEVNTLFISALLIILGYSVNDTIVIFDRVRENVFNQGRGEDFVEVAGRSLRESIARSVNTSLSTLIPLIALYAFGGESIRWFVLTLIVGLSAGTYSSLFLAVPLLVRWRKS